MKLLQLIIIEGVLLVGGIGVEVRADDAGVDIASRLELFVDEYLIAEMKGQARLTLHTPTKREVALVYNQSWEGNSSGYPTMLRDGELYRMYYRGHRFTIKEKGLAGAHAEVVCYAESKDGIHWTKPELRLVDWEGSKENNIIWIGGGSHNFSPFIDENPDCQPDAKFKAVGSMSKSGLVAFKSGDGIHWSKMREDAVFTKGAFDSRNTAFWDPARERYTLYFRYFTGKNYTGRRAIAAAYSKDFFNWTDPEPLVYPDSPPQQMYTNQVIPYYRARHLLLGFPTRYIARETTEHVKRLDPVGLRARLTRAVRRAGSDLSDGLFMSSRDGISFRRWDEAFIRPGPQHEGRWIYGDNYQAYGLVETKAADGSKEISLYVSEGAWRDGEARERRYSIRVDGFVSAQAPFSGGEVVTKPLRFAGKQLVMNYSTSAAGSVRVEIQDASGKPFPGFSLADCGEHYGDTLDQVVAWKTTADVSQLAGKPVRLRFVLKDADLYSFRFQP